MVFKYFRIGKIVNTQGINGEVRIIPLTEDINRFNDLKSIYLDDEKLIKINIEYVKYNKNFVIMKLQGFDSINESEKLKNTYILVDRDKAIKLPAGRYFVGDLINMDVYDINNNSLGKISDIISTGSNDVYVVKKDNEEILIPALKSVVKSIDIVEGRMSVELPEGLI